MTTTQPHSDLQVHGIYRIAYNATNKTIAGNLVVFLGYQDVFGNRRAHIRVVGTEESHLVQPGIIIGF